MRLPKSKKAGNSRTKASIAFFIIAQLILAIFASSTAIAASIKYDDSYTYDGGSSSDAIAWGGSSLNAKVQSYPSSTKVACFDWCGDGTVDKCYGESGDVDKCKKSSSTLKGYCNAGKCETWGWLEVWRSVGEWHGIGTGSAGDRWTCSISSRYFYDCTGTSNSYGDTSKTPYYVVYPRKFDCDEQKISTYDDEFYVDSWYDFRADLSCSGSRLCNEDKDDSDADFGLYGTSKPNEPCSVPDEKEDCNSDSDCFSGSICDCDNLVDCTWDIGSGNKDYCCPSGQKWDGSKCVTPCTDNDGDGHKDSSCGGDDCNDNDGGVWQKNSCQVCAKEPSGIGDSCTVGVGACQKTGKYECDAAGTGIECDVSPGSQSTETCNSVDDDCDGETDEGVKNACGSCGDVPSETCSDGKDNDCDGSIDEGCCTDPKEPYYCAKTSSCWASKAQCDQTITCDNVWVACKKPEGNVIKCVRDVPGCCNAGVPYFCPESGYCFSSDTYCDGRKVENCNGKYQICNKKTDEGKCFGDTLRCCPQGETWWESDKQCHKSTEPQKCSVPDGSSANCDCDSDSECAKADPSKPYCEENYPQPISDGHDACIASPPEYCGNGKCAGSENYNNCASDCGQNAPKGTITTEVVYYGGSQKDKPIQGAYVYLDGASKGNTDKDGKLSFQASYGSRTVKVECPDTTFCDSITVNLAASSEYKRVRCTCNPPGDSDNDGYSDDDERLLGTDPKNANSNFDTTFTSDSVDLLACIPTPATFFIIWKEYKKSGSIIQSHSLVVNSLNVTSVTSTSFEEKPYVIAQALVAANLDAEGAEVIVNPVNVTLENVMKKAEYVDGVRMQDGILLIATDKDGQTTALIAIGAGCVGAFTGSVYGIGQGLFDDIKGMIDGIWFLITHIGEVKKIWSGAQDLVTGVVELLKSPGEAVWTLFRNILDKGQGINLFREGGLNQPEPYRHFQVGFVYGFVTGYLVEQVALGAAILKNVAKFFKLGQLFGKTGKAAKLMEKLEAVKKAEDFGAEIAEKLSKLKYIKEGIDNWLDSEIKGLARIIKHNEDWLKGLSEAEAKVAAKHADELTAVGKVSDAAFGDLTKTKLGQHTLKASDATTDLLTKQSKLVEKWGVKKADEVVSKCVAFICYGSRIDDLNKVLKAMPENLVDDFDSGRAVKFLGNKDVIKGAEALAEFVDKSTLAKFAGNADDFEAISKVAGKAKNKFGSLDSLYPALKSCLGVSGITTATVCSPADIEKALADLKGLGKFSDNVIGWTLDGIKAGVIDINKVAPDKLAGYIKAIGKNPFNSALGDQKLVKMLKREGGATKVGNQVIDDVVVLLEGKITNPVTKDGFGRIHIIEKHTADFTEKLGIKTQDEIMDVIQEVLEKGTKVPGNPDDPQNYVLLATISRGQKTNAVRVIINQDVHLGSVTSAYPVG